MPRLAALVLLLAAGPVAAAPLVFYDDAPRAGLNDYSWATHTLANATPVHGGNRSIRFEPDGYGGIYLVDQATPYRFADYAALRFWVHGGTTGNQRLQLFLTRSGLNVAEVNVATYISGGAVAANQWREVVVPFDASTTLTHGVFDGFMLMDYSGNDQGVAYVDDVSFSERTTPLASAPLSATVNVAGVLRAVNPEIYGVNFGDDAQHADLRYPVRRSGGNSTSRYNWQSDSHNTASDYFYQNIADGSGSGLPNDSTANAFVAATRASGGQAIVTMPVIGWVPLGDRVKRWGYSILKYGPQDQNECSIYNPVPPWCSADAGNGECANVVNNTGFCVNGKIVGNDPADTSTAVTPAWATGWVNHLVARHGLAASGGVRYYSLDNEVMLWNSTHRDVHPTPPTYDEIWQRGRDWGAAIKQADPGAKVLGPVTWGWCDLFTSAADAAVGPSCITGADRTAHGGLPFLEWYIQQVCANPLPGGALRVDYADIHYYPQGGVTGLGGASDDETPPTSAKRLRSLRELYDPNWVAESWVGADGSKPQLIPRVRGWIAARCPAMKLSLTEYKWGADVGASGALAQAEALAIFGREGVDLATRWVAPEPGSLAERAFRLFLDYDGTNTRVVGNALATTSSNADELGAYAVHDTGTRLFVVLVNRATAPRDITVNLSQAATGTWRAFRFDAATPVGQVATGTLSAGTSVLLANTPGRSATLLVLPTPGSVVGGDVVFSNGFE